MTRSRGPRRELIVGVSLAALLAMMGIVWGLTRNHDTWKPELISQDMAGNTEAPRPMPIGGYADEEPASFEPALAAAPAPAATERSHNFALFDGVGSSSAPRKVESPSAPAAEPTAGVTEVKETPAVSTAATSVVSEPSKETDIQPDGFEPGFVLPPPPVTTSSTGASSESGQSTQEPERQRPSRDEGEEGEPGSRPGGGRGGRGGGGRGGR